MTRMYYNFFYITILIAFPCLSFPITEEDISLLKENNCTNAVELLKLEQYDKALQHIQYGLEICKKKQDINTVETAEIEYILTRVLLELGKDEEALYHIEHVLANYKNHYKDSNVKIICTQIFYGLILYKLEKYEKSAKLLKNTLNDYIKFHGNRGKLKYYADYHLAKSLHKLGRNEEAYTHSKKALENFEKYFGSNFETIAKIKSLLGEILYDLCNYTEALEFLIQAAKDYKKLGKKKLSMGTSLFCAHLLSKLKKDEEAKAYIEKIIETCKKHNTKEHNELRIESEKLLTQISNNQE